MGWCVVGLIWMFAGVIIISSFTAAITSSLTLGGLQGPVQGPADLARARVGTVDSSTTAEYLAARHIAFARYSNPLDALRALEAGALDAVVYDAPILRFDIHAGFNGRLRVLPSTFERQYYGIALPNGSPLREEINRALLARVEAPEWAGVLARYLGR